MAERVTSVDYIWKGNAVPGDNDCLVVIVNDKAKYDQMVEDESFDPMVWFTFADEAEFQRAFDPNNEEFDFTLVREYKDEPCAHEGTMGILDVYRETVTCEACGYTEDADEDDLLEQKRLLAEMDKH